ncbi:MAG TPA: hypothetical protein VKS21_11480 [Spirochaetota bacterium]|nr:hypothetical protein [Spirochaetota bacterium]
MKSGSYNIKIKKKVLKKLPKLPESIQGKLKLLVDDLELLGPEQPQWPNYSKLGENKYHCHLSYKWVACWKNENNNVTIEVYYAGSRESAPY